MPQVYIIKTTLGNECYVGSTKLELKDRLERHKSSLSLCASRILFKKYGVENCYIESLEILDDNIEDEDKRIREQYYIDLYKDTKVNIKNAYTSHEDYVIYFKSYKKSYCEANKEALAIKNKAYRQANKENISIKNKAYRETNKEDIAIKKKAKCEAKKLLVKNIL